MSEEAEMFKLFRICIYIYTFTDFIFLGFKITADGDCSHEIKRCLLLGRKAMTNLKSILKSRDITLPTRVRLVKAMVFPVVMYGCESWTIKKAEYRRIDAFELRCWRRLLRVPWTVLEKTLESHLDSKKIKLVHPEGNQSWIFIGKTDAQVETPMLWPLDVRIWPIGKYSDAGKDWRMTEYNWLYEYEFEQALGVDVRQGSLASCSPWDCKELDSTELLNWTELVYIKSSF